MSCVAARAAAFASPRVLRVALASTARAQGPRGTRATVVKLPRSRQRPARTVGFTARARSTVQRTTGPKSQKPLSLTCWPLRKKPASASNPVDSSKIRKTKHFFGCKLFSKLVVGTGALGSPSSCHCAVHRSVRGAHQTYPTDTAAIHAVYTKPHKEIHTKIHTGVLGAYSSRARQT